MDILQWFCSDFLLQRSKCYEKKLGSWFLLLPHVSVTPNSKASDYKVLDPGARCRCDWLRCSQLKSCTNSPVFTKSPARIQDWITSHFTFCDLVKTDHTNKSQWSHFSYAASCWWPSGQAWFSSDYQILLLRSTSILGVSQAFQDCFLTTFN